MATPARIVIPITVDKCSRKGLYLASFIFIAKWFFLISGLYHEDFPFTISLSNSVQQTSRHRYRAKCEREYVPQSCGFDFLWRSNRTLPCNLEINDQYIVPYIVELQIPF